MDCFFENWMLMRWGCGPSLLRLGVSPALHDATGRRTYCHSDWGLGSRRFSTPNEGLELETDQAAREPTSRRLETSRGGVEVSQSFERRTGV